jgi:GNAT superfamily N-acetyltransferase
MSKTTISTFESENEPFTLEPAKPEDAEGVFNVQRLTWLDTYPNAEAGITEENIRVRVEGEHGELIPNKIERWRNGIEAAGDEQATFVVRDGNNVIGFTAPAIREGQKRIGAIYVLPEAQGKGVGTKLLRKAIEWHGRKEDIYLHVTTYNRNAIDFYKINGFEETGNEIRDDVAQIGNGKKMPQLEMVLRAKSD